MVNTTRQDDHFDDVARRIRAELVRARKTALETRLDMLRRRVSAALDGPPALRASVYLFGSWASGRFDGQSDIDLLVIAADERTAQEAQRLLMAIGDDVLAVTEEQWNRLVEDGDPFFLRVEKERRLLADTAGSPE